MSEAVTWAWAQVTKEIPYNPSFSDGAGNFDGIIYGPDAPALKPGQIHKVEVGAGKKGFVVGTYFGNVAVFETRKGDFRIYAKDAFFNNGAWFERGIMSEGDLEVFLGKRHNDISKNIGWICREVYLAAKKFIEEHPATVSQ